MFYVIRSVLEVFIEKLRPSGPMARPRDPGAPILLSNLELKIVTQNKFKYMKIF